MRPGRVIAIRHNIWRQRGGSVLTGRVTIHRKERDLLGLIVIRNGKLFLRQVGDRTTLVAHDDIHFNEARCYTYRWRLSRGEHRRNQEEKPESFDHGRIL